MSLGPRHLLAPQPGKQEDDNSTSTKWASKSSVCDVITGPVRRLEQCFDIKGTVQENWVEVIIARVDGRGRGIPAAKRVKEIADTNGWKLAPRSPQWGGQRREFNRYDGKKTSLIMSIIRPDGNRPPPPRMLGLSIQQPWEGGGSKTGRVQNKGKRQDRGRGVHVGGRGDGNSKQAQGAVSGQERPNTR